MKFDKDAVRDILLAIEDSSDPMQPLTLTFPSRSDVEVSYHVQILSEAGLVDAINFSSSGDYDWKPTRLTFDGHEYLDTIRDTEVWRLTKEGAKKVGSGSISVLLEIGKGIVKQKLIEHGFHLQ